MLRHTGRAEMESLLVSVHCSEKDAIVDGGDTIEAASGQQHSAFRNAGFNEGSRKVNARRILFFNLILLLLFFVEINLLGHSLVRSNRNFNTSQQSDSSDVPKLAHEERSRILPLPDEWQTLSYHDIRRHLNCRARAHDPSKSLPSLEDWQFMREKYSEVVDEDIEFDDSIPPTAGYTLGDRGPPPFVAGYSPGAGRGVFASRDIEKGELVHDGTRSAVTFPDGMAWRRFVFSLPWEMACDVADWSWTQRLSSRGRVRLFVDLNISTLFNNGGKRGSNVNPKKRTSLKFYATRDIEKNSELLFNYHMYKTKWGKVGL